MFLKNNKPGMILFMMILAFNLNLITKAGSISAKSNNYGFNIKENGENKMKEKITTFLTFQEGKAEEAMNYYLKLFDNSEIIDLKRYPEGSQGEGLIMKAVFKLNGKTFICSDSFIKHEWTFSPAISMFVECNSEEEFNRLYETLKKEGRVFMEPNNYGFSKKFTWVEDKYGISWQLNLQE